MTRTDILTCIHEPFGDAFYYGPERLSERYENDPEAREKSGFAKITYQAVQKNIDKEMAKVCGFYSHSKKRDICGPRWSQFEYFGWESVVVAAVEVLRYTNP
jgi:hypothetical protein